MEQEYECQRHSGVAGLGREYEEQLQRASGCKRVIVDQVVRLKHLGRGEEDWRRYSIGLRLVKGGGGKGTSESDEIGISRIGHKVMV